jgi:hypothetical protein
MESHGDDLRRWRIAGGAAAIALAAIATLGKTSAAFTATAPVTGLIESGRVELSAGGVSSLTFSEVLIWDLALTAAERTSVLRALGAKWGITVP